MPRKAEQAKKRLAGSLVVVDSWDPYYFEADLAKHAFHAIINVFYCVKIKFSSDCRAC